MPVTLDPDAAAVYKAFQEAGRPAYETLTAPEAREYYLNARFVSNPEPPELESDKSLSIPAPHGALPARIYTPKKLRKTNGLAPCLVFFHGGGWVIGNLDSHDVVCRMLAHEGELRLEPHRQRSIVGILACHARCARGGDSLVQGRCQTAVRPPHDGDPLVAERFFF